MGYRVLNKEYIYIIYGGYSMRYYLCYYRMNCNTSFKVYNGGIL